MGRSKGAKGDNRGGRGESGPSIQVNQDERSKSDQIRPNQTKSDEKNGPARTKAQACRSKLWRTSVDLGPAGWMPGGSERMNGKGKELSDRNTFFTCDADERGSGLEENLRLSSLKFAYSRLSSLNGRKIVGAPRLISRA